MSFRHSGQSSKKASGHGVWRKLPAVAFLVWLCGVTAYLLPAQNPPSGGAAPAGAKPAPQASAAPGNEESPSSAQKIRVRVNVVNIQVTVLSKSGLPVIDLNKDDFQLYEDGKLQTIRYFSQQSHQPLRIGLIMDTSNSARRQLTFEKDAATEFVFRMLSSGGNRNQIFLQTFDASSSIIQDFTTDPDVLNEKIQGLKAGGGKALYDAIYSACKDKMMHAGQAESTRRILVVITDGIDVRSEHSLDEALSMARKSETLVYTVGNAAHGYANVGDDILQLVSDGTGGGAFFPLKEEPGTDLSTGYQSHGQMGETSQNKGLGAETGVFSAQRLINIAVSMEKIDRELGAQYELGYTPTNDVLNGTYRSVRVLLNRKGITYRWKPGYFAAAE